MFGTLWDDYGWILLVAGLVVLNILFLKPTGQYVSGFHRGVRYFRKETWGDRAGNIVLLLQWLGLIIYPMYSLFFGKH